MKDKLLDLYITQNKTRKETSEILGISIGSLKYEMTKHKIRKRKDLTKLLPLTNHQIEIINGSLLGDGYLKRSKYNWTFSKTQRADRKPYLTWHFKELGGYSCSILQAKSKLKFDLYKNNLKYSYLCKYSTHSHPIFNELARKWYKNENGIFTLNKYNCIIKTIPFDIKLTPLTMAIWYCDDGAHEPEDRKVTICTDCFTDEECKFLIEIIRRDLDINCLIRFHNESPRIYVPVKSYLNFINLVKPFIDWGCYKYKVDLT